MAKGLLWYRKPDWYKGTLEEWRKHLAESKKLYQDYHKAFSELGIMSKDI